MPETTEKNSLPTTIDEVIEQLDIIITTSHNEKSRLGFFAALYRTVTIRVRDGIANGDFDNGERMERLDVIFANRYLEAFNRFKNGSQTTKSWLVAFETAQRWRPLIIQHLLLGMNAHINLDLGIAAVETRQGESLSILESDFMKINEILASLLETVQDKINSLSPGFKFLDKFGGRTDEAVMNFSMERARDEAWKFAQELAILEQAELEQKIVDRDIVIERLGGIVRNPGRLISIFTFIIRLFETSNPSKVIETLF